VGSSRRTALIAGVWFLLTFAFSIPGALLYGSILDDPNYVVGAASDAHVRWGAFLEILTAIANIATALVLFRILRRQSEAISLGYVALRVVESLLIIVGLISLLSILTLRQETGGADSASLVLAGRSLVAVHDWTMLLGPQFCAGFGNGLLLGYLMYKTGLVPRPMALIGLIGGPLAFVAGTGVLFEVYEQGASVQGLLTAPEILWEFLLGVYLTFKGFKPSPVLREEDAEPARQP
jgi:Domain of unknown function (DUF4386)